MDVIDGLRHAVYDKQPATLTIMGVATPVVITSYELAYHAPWTRDLDGAIVPASATIELKMEPARAA